MVFVNLFILWIAKNSKNIAFKTKTNAEIVLIIQNKLAKNRKLLILSNIIEHCNASAQM